MTSSSCETASARTTAHYIGGTGTGDNAPMRASGRWLGGVVVVALAAAAWPVVAGQQFRAGVELVRLPVVVTGKDGLLTRGLTAADFEILEDGVAQKVSAFSEGAPGETLPLHLGLLLDVSESMDLDLRDAQSAAIQFVNAFEEAADVTLLDFDQSIRLGRFTRENYQRLAERIRLMKATGGTALYDALGVYLESATSRGGQHVLLMYTDGGDSRSKLTFPQIVDSLRFANVIVYALGYLDNQSGSTRGIQQSQLSLMARETGGEAFFPASRKDLEAVYARILSELASRYTIGYESTNTKADGRFRKVQVRLKPPHDRGSKVRTRSGYIVPIRR